MENSNSSPIDIQKETYGQLKGCKTLFTKSSRLRESDMRAKKEASNKAMEDEKELNSRKAFC